MAKKRKSDATACLDEVDRTMYSTFCSAANSLSQFHTQAMAQQRAAFHAGERHAMEKLYQWISRQHQEGARLTAADVVSYIQKENNYGEEDSLMSPILQSPRQHVQSTMHFISPSTENSGLPAQETMRITHGNGHSAETGSVFSNALPSPALGNMQPSHVSQGGYFPNNKLPSGFGARNHELDSPNQGRNSTTYNEGQHVPLNCSAILLKLQIM